MTFDNVSIYNLYQAITLNSGGNVILQNGSLIYANGKLNLSVSGNMAATDSHLIGDTALFTALSGSIRLDNAKLDVAHQAIFIAPEIDFNNSTLNAESLVLNGSGAAKITIDNTTLNSSSSLTILAPGDLNITGSGGEQEEFRSVGKVAANSGSALLGPDFRLDHTDIQFRFSEH